MAALSARERAAFDALRAPDEARWIVVAFWGAETTRKTFKTRNLALGAAQKLAEQNADVHVARVIAFRAFETDGEGAECVDVDDNTRAQGGGK